MVLSNIKTPGVYVEEVSLFPPSVAPVATAVPAFIGYTADAIDKDGRSLRLKPVKIRSLLDFTTLFGNGYEPTQYITVIKADTGAIQSAEADKQFFLFDAVRQFFDNGGSECYIVSVDNFKDGGKKLETGLQELKKIDEPTLLLFPDACARNADTLVDIAAIADIQKQALQLCATMQDRFTILDIAEGDKEGEPGEDDPVTVFRNNIGVNALSYGAAYYPWIVTNYDINFSLRKLVFVKDSDMNDPLELAELDDFSKDGRESELLAAYGTARALTDTFLKKLYPADAADEAKLNTHAAKGVTEIQDKLNALEQAFNNGSDHAAKLKDYLDYVAGLLRIFPQVAAEVAGEAAQLAVVEGYKQDRAFINSILYLIAFEKNAKVIDNTGRTEAQIKDTVYVEVLNGWTNEIAFADISLEVVDPVTAALEFPNTKEGSRNVMAKVREKVLGAIIGAYNNLFFIEAQADKALFSQHGFLKGVGDKIREKMRTIPPSGTMAGIYSLIDSTRGVWKAPANVSINATLGPAVKIDNKMQDDLNVHTTGKSVNAIRSFTGKGTLVWGARTLAGNDNEWRYVPVRRFFIMVEESVKKATEPFVFENNDANTWIKVKVMIENFLTLQWRAGALQGAKPEDAFFVKVGLNETMTQDDLLNGRMIVEIGMAAVRPAEFIILRFSHKMMEK